jgi:hypothetical protein
LKASLGKKVEHRIKRMYCRIPEANDFTGNLENINELLLAHDVR